MERNICTFLGFQDRNCSDYDLLRGLQSCTGTSAFGATLCAHLHNPEDKYLTDTKKLKTGIKLLLKICKKIQL